jgi:hypothetical protein
MIDADNPTGAHSKPLRKPMRQQRTRKAAVRVTLEILGCASAALLFAACGGSTGSSNQTAADAACQGSGCQPAAQPPAPLVCGGASEAQCPQGYRCMADALANCSLAANPTCTGTCVLGETLPTCGADGTCPDGYVCVTNTDADGTCSDGNVGCPSTCRPKADGQCTTDADCPQLRVACSVCADGSVTCPTSGCDGGQCRVDFKPCVEPPPPAGCAAIRCAAGFHCIEDAACAPDAAGVCKAACVPDEPTAQCGGITGQACPPGLECVDDPNDTCDPRNGGADCSGLCQVTQGGECTTDAECPQLRAPCSVCADGTVVCPHASCENGTCNVDFPTCGAPVTCGSDGCKPGYLCVSDPNGMCNPADPTTGCTGVCVPDNTPRTCGGAAGDTCPPGYTCTLDASTGCRPDASGAGCTGMCLPEQPPPPQCSADADCVQILACMPCPDGAYACPRSECRNGICATTTDACVGSGFCGGIAGFPCPPGSTCIDNPNDGCDPKQGGADCGGVCVREEEPPTCGGFTGAPCPDGYDCADNPRDDCDPAQGGADCPGICRPAPSPKCAGDADCPVIGAPCRLCADGTAACPRSYCANGVCTAEFKTCGGQS